MPQRLIWTAPQEVRLKRLRAEGHSWDRISGEMGISRNAAIERGRKIGARLPQPELKDEPEDPDRPALAPGHPASWGAITDGTCLAGEPYVYEDVTVARRKSRREGNEIGVSTERAPGKLELLENKS